MSPPDPLCHWAAGTQQQQPCLSRGDPKLPCTQHPIPGCVVGQWTSGSPRCPMHLSRSCPHPAEGSSPPTPGMGIRLSPRAGAHLPWLTDVVATLGHLKPPRQYLLCCTAGVPYEYFLLQYYGILYVFQTFYFCAVLCS